VAVASGDQPVAVCHPAGGRRVAAAGQAGAEALAAAVVAGGAGGDLPGACCGRVFAADGVLARTLPSPLPPTARGRLHGTRIAGPAPAPATAALRVTRVVSSQGALMVAGVKIHLGHIHRGKIVTVIIEETQFRILHDGTQLSTHPRTVIKEVTRRSASG
jgi:hypothetical protein